MGKRENKYQCVIFDCDGVLVDSEPIGNQVMVDMANSLGANITLDYAYQHFKGNALYKCMEHIRDLIEKDLPQDFETQYRSITFQKFKDEVQPVHGVVDVIRSLDIPYCVASSGPVNKIKLNLESTGLLEFFEQNIFSCYTIKKWKPNPAVFIWAAETMGFKNTDCVVIEDSSLGVEAALNGGFDVFGFTAHDYRDELQEKATKTFDSMLNLKELLMI
ncbi:HAD family hydrolase [Winogradskyella sp. DF17]|uniref:HAD family hydrolase n=1 Tax=Winogradskyella pelagia TaxID=2819984 RepID=A0ABS3T3H8_9FLAO|nr:HAD family hydrolase [Winogradskyella sp. DF17]MBO3117298.1 HAD family hydrolase [Winogradskyella sp. DF17]